MKKTILIVLNILLMMPFFIFYRRGANVAIYMLPIWGIMTIVNTICAPNIRQLILCNVSLAVFTTIGIFINGQLYFKYIHWDSVGEAIIQLEMIVEVIYIAILTGIEILIKYYAVKKKSLKSFISNVTNNMSDALKGLYL